MMGVTMEGKREYVVATIIQTNYPLDGVYKFEDYTLYPGVFSGGERFSVFSKTLDFPLSYFVITVSIGVSDELVMQTIKRWYESVGFSNEEATFYAERECRSAFHEFVDPWRNRARLNGIAQIEDFVAWLSCITRSWMKPYYESAGRHMRTILCTLSAEEFDKEGLKKLEEDTGIKIDETKKGGFVDVGRPNLSAAPEEVLKLPSDFVALTKQLFSLNNAKRKKFLNACRAYGFALDHMAVSPSLSFVGLVSAVDALRPSSEKSSRGWFVTCGESLLNSHSDLLSDHQKKLLKSLGEIYGERRSKFVHGALLGDTYETRSMLLGMLHDATKSLDFGMQLGELEKLINAYLIKWLEDNAR
jgi:hypothetical protein